MKSKDVIGSIRGWIRRDSDSVKSSHQATPNRSSSSTREQSQLIDELTDKLMETEIKLAAAQIQGRLNTAQGIVKTHMIAGSSLALLPVPLFDLAALTGTQLSLLRSLSMHYEVDFDEQKGKVLLTSLVSGAMPVLTVVGLSSFAKLIPGIGSVGGGISMTVLTSSLVYATGQVFIRHFEQGGTLENFQGKHWKNFFNKTLKEKKITINDDYLEGKEIAKA